MKLRSMSLVDLEFDLEFILLVTFLGAIFICFWQDARMAVADTSLVEVAADVPGINRVSLRTRKTLRGHLAKIYAMHWATDSR